MAKNGLYSFQNGLWQDVPNVLWKIAGLIHNWRILYPSEKMQELELPQIRKAEILSKTTWKIRELAGDLKEDRTSPITLYSWPSGPQPMGRLTAQFFLA